jgi:hypothetical protein
VLGGSHEPVAIRGTRERAAPATEQLALDQRIRDRSTVDGDHRAAALRERVNRLGRDLLAGARLST